MDLQTLEYAATLFFDMCRAHPEVCPHDFCWESSKPSETEGKREVIYKCRLCGKEEIKIEQE